MILGKTNLNICLVKTPFLGRGFLPSLFYFWQYYLVFEENTGISSKFLTATSPLALPGM
jgi:hypothetical protein